MSRRAMMRYARSLLILTLLLIVLLNVWFSKVREEGWQQPVTAFIYPINADGSELTQAWIDALTLDDFHEMERFFNREARRYRLPLERPIQLQLVGQIHAIPPDIPHEPSILDGVIWALSMRYWAWKYDESERESDTIRIFIRFYSPDNPRPMQHSLGLQKGMIGVVNGYAGQEHLGRNQLVAAHELLHTLGATDKYDMDTLAPVWPDGYADPTQYPLFPQTRAEIMSGRLQLAPGWLMLPPSLEYAMIGAATAIEIGWLAPHYEVDKDKR